MKTSSVLAASAALVLAAVWALTAANQPDAEALWRHRNLGKALFETPTTVAESCGIEESARSAPNSFRDRLSYGLALLRAGQLEKGIGELENAEAEPDIPHTWFNLGIAEARRAL